MLYKAKVEIRLKPSLSDPEGMTSASSLRDLGYQVENVTVGKVYYILLEAGSEEEAYRKADEMCNRLLANPVKDNFYIEVERIR